MPKIHEEVIKIKIYKLIKNQDNTESIISSDMVDALSDVVEELLNDSSLIVEVEKD